MPEAMLMFVHALTSLHAGTGQGVGVIDLPIARERATDLPLVPGSSLKGCLREKYRGEVDLFGCDDLIEERAYLRVEPHQNLSMSEGPGSQLIDLAWKMESKSRWSRVEDLTFKLGWRLAS